jgi:protocatechuate 3,4-dioxygenase alpha subunit
MARLPHVGGPWSGNLTPHKLRYLKESASQTAGPYVHIGLAPGAAGFRIFENELGQDIAGPNASGERIRVEGLVIDGTDTPVKDVMLEVWQANAHGRYNHPEDRQEKPLEEGFRGWGRIISDFETGLWRFETVKPGVVPGRNRRQMAPHINLWIVARGINIGLHTRMYFSDETAANEADPVLNLIEQVERRSTLIAKRSEQGGAVLYRFDIHLQGERETVFFDV